MYLNSHSPCFYSVFNGGSPPVLLNFYRFKCLLIMKSNRYAQKVSQQLPLKQLDFVYSLLLFGWQIFPFFSLQMELNVLCPSQLSKE